MLEYRIIYKIVPNMARSIRKIMHCQTTYKSNFCQKQIKYFHE